jgi:hypothetical protein
MPAWEVVLDPAFEPIGMSRSTGLSNGLEALPDLGKAGGLEVFGSGKRRSILEKLRDGIGLRAGDMRPILAEDGEEAVCPEADPCKSGCGGGIFRGKVEECERVRERGKGSVRFVENQTSVRGAMQGRIRFEARLGHGKFLMELGEVVLKPECVPQNPVAAEKQMFKVVSDGP